MRINLSLLPTKFLAGVLAGAVLFSGSAVAYNSYISDNTPEGGYLLCANTKTKVVTFPNKASVSYAIWHFGVDFPVGAGGAREGIRTPNLLIRSQMLYPLSYARLLNCFCCGCEYYRVLRLVKNRQE